MKSKSLLLSLASTLVLACLNSSLAADVTFRESDKTFFLNNGILDVRIEKSSGDVFSIKYQGVELLAQSSPGGALGGYWSSVGGARSGTKREALVRIDPAGNGGSRVEVACRFYNEPGHPEAPLDVEIRYSLARGESALHTYLIWRHKPGYPAFGVGEARFAVKLNPDVFDYMTIDEQRRRIMPAGDDWDRGQPTNLKEARRMTTGIHKGHVEHKYDYSALIYEIPAYGWSSTTYRLGFWFVNPSFEYMAGGPTKAELTGHLDVNTGGTPTLLNMWLGSHYGGSSLVVGQDEDWTKVIGPFVIYCNSLPETQSVANTDAMHRALWKDALTRAEKESAAWPYDWVTHPDYPPAAHRATIAGRIVLRDPFEPHATMSNLWVGVTAPDYLPPARTGFGQRSRTNTPAEGSFTNAPGRGLGGFARGGFPPHVDW
ncbi:MAG TPA: lyase, partial [Verrucomicrobiota bacterium]|nr:lyase [Verrucomicrobiota bacterium]